MFENIRNSSAPSPLNLLLVGAVDVFVQSQVVWFRKLFVDNIMTCINTTRERAGPGRSAPCTTEACGIYVHKLLLRTAKSFGK